MSRTIGTFKYTSALPLVTALAATLLGLCGLTPRAAQARAYTYGTGAQRTVNAGILLLDNNTSSHSVGSENKDPYVFYILNQRTDIKPFGWNIINPMAPSAVTPEIQSRWDSRTNNSTTGANLLAANGGHAYQLGQTVTPAMAAYWEVPLSSTRIDNLKQFDVLLVNVDGNCAFTAADSEKLRRFVDGGGTLWIENSGFNTANSNITVSPFVNLRYTGSTPGNAYGQYSYLNRSPVITSPYYLSQTELNGLGDKQIGNYGMTDGNAALPGPNLVAPVLVSSNSAQPVIAIGQYGAGQILITNTGSANTINQYVGGINVYGNNDLAGNSGPYSGTNLNLAPTNDLKLLANILAAADAHPQALQNSHQNGASNDPLTSPTQVWKDTDNTGGIPTGAAAYGNLAYVTTNGKLYAYYMRPSQDPNPYPSFVQGKPYDLKWYAPVGDLASAPTVATVPAPNGGSQTLVFVEKKDGTVVYFDAAPVAPDTSSPQPVKSTLNNSGGRGSYTAQPAPAPTYFNGSIYAGGADGSLFVYNFNAGYSTSGGVSYGLASSAGTQLVVTSSPTVGIIPDGDGGTGNEIIALVPTSQYIYSVYLGARGERLSGTYGTKLPANTQFDWQAPGFQQYSLNTDGTPNTTTQLTRNGANNGFAAPNPAVPYFADYDALIQANPTGAGSLTRVAVGVVSAADALANVATAISPPALDRAGNGYYTGYVPGTSVSRLFSYHDAPTNGRTLNWCFQLPRSTDTIGTIIDADGTDYANTALIVSGVSKNASLAGFRFVGAPVTDGQGNVYALATNINTGQTAVLCFNTLTGVSADLFGQGLEGPTSGVQVSQPDPLNAALNLFGDPIPNGNPQGSQLVIGPTGHIDFKNFGTGGTAAGVTSGLYPNIAEPYPVAVQYNVGDINQAGNQTPPQQTYARMHTNVSWYTIIPNAVSTNGGLTKAGNTLFYVDSTGTLQQVVADPQAEGFTITSKFIPSDAVGTSGSTMVTTLENVGVNGTQGVATPAVSNGNIVLAGAGGVAVYTNQVTLVTDANRVLEMDSSGNAQWAVDATTRLSLEGDTTPIYSVSPSSNTGAAGTGQIVTTTLQLNRPSSLTELTPNDYLIADTGNSRCVRFDRAGRVLWELTKFNDDIAPAINKTALLLKPGEPDTLNQPTSVQIRETTDTNNNVLVQYLISDTGNFRIVEIDDVYDSTGKPVLYHQLAWVSHTHDLQDREYRYQSAAYYNTPSGNFVVALITNKRLALQQPNNTLPANNATTGALLPANQDGNGGSIVFLTYDSANPTNGYITNAVSSFTAKIDPTTSKFEPVAGNPILLYLRNPRYLKAYPTPGASPSSPYKNLLLADDNGAWDLTPNAALNGYNARFGFTQADYRDMTIDGANGSNKYTPIDANGVAFGLANNQYFTPRQRFPFTPSSIQLLAGLDTALVSSTNIPLTRYLITNSYSQGEAANAVGGGVLGNYTFPGFSGEVFQVSHSTNGNQITGGYGGHTLSRPANTSPLNQPTFAYRLQ